MQHEKGLDYIGYYKTQESNTSSEYNFIFVESGIPKTRESYHLQFESKA